MLPLAISGMEALVMPFRGKRLFESVKGAGMTSADMGRPVEPRLSAEPRRPVSVSIVPLATVISCAVIGLDQGLHTTPTALSASPLAQTAQWAGDGALAVPFAAVALGAGGWLGRKLGISMTSTSGVFAQACVVTLVLAVLLVPAWFGHDAIDRLAPAVPSAAGAGHAGAAAGHAGHDHGGPPLFAASWGGSGVLYLMMSIPLAAAAVYVGQRAADKLAPRLEAETDVVVRTAVSVGAVALALGLGWFLQGVASQSNTLLTYASGFSVVHAHHFAHAHLAPITQAAVQPPFGSQ